MKNREVYLLLARVELARRSFWWYCRLRVPAFYTAERTYLRRLCDAFQNFYAGTETVLILNMPPRHGKSLTATLFTEWILGKNTEEKIMTASYNSTLSTDFSKQVRNAIQEEKADADRIIYADIFPKTRIKRGDAGMKMWTLEGAYKTYLATAPRSTATGFGATIEIFDDVLKNAEEALNEETLEKIWVWFTDTMSSRLEPHGKQIFIMTRWAEGDLAGRMLKWCAENNRKCVHLNFTLTQEDGSILEGSPLTAERIADLKKLLSPEIFAANYEQKPLDVQGRLYTSFRSYLRREDGETEEEYRTRLSDAAAGTEAAPEAFDSVLSYTDTADEGSDFLCSIVYGIKKGKNTEDAKIYLLDVLFTDAAMEYTEPAAAEMFAGWEVAHSLIESNNGGRGWGRSVERILRESFPACSCEIEGFTQRKNKEARILSQSADAMRLVYFPYGWSEEWPAFFSALTHYVRRGKNAHDDAPDALTGVIEMSRNLEYIQ